MGNSLNPLTNLRHQALPPPQARETRLKELKQIETTYPKITEINHPSRVLVIGRSQSGKTTLAVKLIKRLIAQVDEVYVCSPTYNYQETWNDIRHEVTLAHESAPVMLQVIKQKLDQYDADESGTVGNKIPVKRLIIFDDVSYEKSLNERSGKGTLNGLQYNAVWMNISIVTIVHETKNIGSGTRTSTDFLIMFRCINQEEEEVLFKTFGVTRTKKEFFELFKVLIHDVLAKERDRHPFISVNYKNGGKISYKLANPVSFE